MEESRRPHFTYRSKLGTHSPGGCRLHAGAVLHYKLLLSLYIIADCVEE